MFIFATHTFVKFEANNFQSLGKYSDYNFKDKK